MALAIDASGNSDATGLAIGGTSMVLSNPVAGIKTSQPGNIVLAFIHAETANVGFPVISSVSGSTLGAFSLYGSISINIGSFSQEIAAIYWCYASNTLSSLEQVTVTFAASPALDDATMVVTSVTGFTGTTYTTNPWDHAFTSADTAQSATSSAPSATMASTLNANTMVWDFIGIDVANDPGTPTGGAGSWTVGSSLVNGGGTVGSCSRTYFNTFTSTQSNLTVTHPTSIPRWTMSLAALSQTGPFVGGSIPPGVCLNTYFT